MVNHPHASTKLIPESQAIVQFGRSRSFFKRARNSGRLLYGVWLRVNNRILYNEALLTDWFVNQTDPEAHEQARQAFLESLPSSKPRRHGRKAKTSTAQLA
jgi:hypothetical protein